MSSHVSSQLMDSVTNVYVNPLDFALASLAWLSLVRSAAVSISVNHSSSFVESCSLKTAMSCSRELVRCVCFCTVYSVSMYWCTTSPNGSVGVGVEVGCVLTVRESVHSSCSRLSMQSNSSTGSPSPASICCHKLCISLASMFRSAWLLGRRLPRQPSASVPLRAIVVSEQFVLSLSSMFLVPSTWELRSLSSPACPAPLW